MFFSSSWVLFYSFHYLRLLETFEQVVHLLDFWKFRNPLSSSVYIISEDSKYFFWQFLFFVLFVLFCVWFLLFLGFICVLRFVMLFLCCKLCFVPVSQYAVSHGFFENHFFQILFKQLQNQVNKTQRKKSSHE